MTPALAISWVRAFSLHYPDSPFYVYLVNNRISCGDSNPPAWWPRLAVAEHGRVYKITSGSRGAEIPASNTHP